jgi:hypothetical protein
MTITAAFFYRIQDIGDYVKVPIAEPLTQTTNIAVTLTVPLNPSPQTYQYYASATDSVSGQTVVGDVLTFTMQDQGAPTINSSVGLFGVTSATLSANLSAFGGAATAAKTEIGYGINQNDDSLWTWAQVGDGKSLGTFTLPLTLLTPGATVYFGARATNNLGGISKSSSNNFLVGNVVTDGPATSITPTQATLHGTVNFASLISLLRGKRR